MAENNDYFDWLAKGDRIRTSVRAILFDTGRVRILVEKNVEIDSPFFNFIGGGLEVGETMVQCLGRELSEETNASICEAKYLFVVEHFIHYEGEVRHSLEHYFEVMLDRTDVLATNSGLLYKWIPIDELSQVDLRPSIVRNCLLDGTYRHINHLVSTNVGA